MLDVFLWLLFICGSVGAIALIADWQRSDRDY
jgi:hypothetical protein